MKNSSKILLLSLGSLMLITLAVAFVPNSCSANTRRIYYSDAPNPADSRAPIGSSNRRGSTVSQKYSFADNPFNAIVLKGGGEMKVQVTHQLHTANATLTTDSNLLPYIDVYVQGKTLYIGKRDHVDFYPWAKIKVTVNAEDLKSISTHGSGDSTIDNIDTDEFAAEINGSGNTILQGKTKELAIKIHGSGNINTKKLDAADVAVSISGSGDVVTNATQKIRAEISGSGSIEYYGNPQKVAQSISGSGKIMSAER